MRSFLKFLAASVLGNFIAFFAAMSLVLIIVFGIMSSVESSFGDKDLEIKDETVLVLNLNKPIVDQGTDESNEIDELFSDYKLGLNQIIKGIKRATDDNRIKGILFKADGYRAGLATTEEIRNAIKDFKKSKKFIYSYAENYGQLGYYLASVSDSIFIYPEGDMELKGFSSQYPYFKGLMDKMDIEVQVIRGKENKFKSAVEPFVLSEMSAENRLQIKQLLGTVWKNMTTNLSVSRQIDTQIIDSLAQNYLIRSAQDGIAHNLIDCSKYYDQVLDLLRQKLKIKNDGKINSVGIGNYCKAKLTDIEKAKKKKEDDENNGKIGIIYASGDIVTGSGQDENIGSDKISKVIRKIRLDSTIKAVVLRINSPGGSALASDVIWREVKLTTKEKPVVVSMGDLAASGGYYIAAAADKIVCQPTTITGSIGVFGLIPNFKNLMKNKLGVNFDTVKTNKYSDIGNLMRKIKPDEFDIIQTKVDTIYSKFVKKVADGRGIHSSRVHEIAQGRVWSGIDAYHIGLADELGGLDKAIASAAELANIKNYKTVNYPKKKNQLEKIFSKISNESESKIIHSYLMKYSQYKDYYSFINILEDPSPQARLLLNFNF